MENEKSFLYGLDPINSFMYSDISSHLSSSKKMSCTGYLEGYAVLGVFILRMIC